VRAEHGMTLIEVLVTSLVLVVGMMATLAIFSKSSKTAVTAERRVAMVSVAQREIERLRPLPYEQLGLSAAIAPDAATVAPPGSPAEGEAVVPGGVVAPGPEPFAVEGMTGKVYRYVTWRAQDCPLVNTRISTRVANELGVAQADVSARLGDMCPGTTDTKRITVVVVPDSTPETGGPFKPIRLASMFVDPSGGVADDPTGTSLRVDIPSPGQTLSPAGSPDPGQVYDDAVEQSHFLTDTPCENTGRIPVTASHSVRDTSINGSTCTGKQPDLMVAQAPGGPAGGTLFDYSSDLPRAVPGGLVIKGDDRDDACGTAYRYSNASAERRKRSVHTWASVKSTQVAKTAAAGGRATFSIWTSTADGSSSPGRLCVTLWQRSTGAVLGKVQYDLPAWPDEPTPLAVSFDLEHVTIPAGERLMLTARVPSSSGSDISLFYDHAAYPGAVSIAMQKGSEWR